MEQLTAWVDGYVRAWNSNDPAEIRALFTDDAKYATEPYREPWCGVDTIVAQWLEHRDEPGQTTFSWEPVALTDEVSVIRGTTRYPDRTFANLWVIALAPDGRCRRFTEWWMQHPAGS